MATHINGEDGAISDPDVGSAVDLEFGVDNTTVRKRKHGARSTGVVFSVRVALEPLFPLLVGLDVRSG